MGSIFRGGSRVWGFTLKPKFPQMSLSRVPGEMFDTCEIWGSLSGVTEDPSSQGYYTVSTGGNVAKDRCAFVFRVRAVQEDWTVLLRTVTALRFPKTSVSICGCTRRNIGDGVILIWMFAACLSDTRQKNLTLETQLFRSTWHWCDNRINSEEILLVLA
jgi:hypothetical protein